MPALAESISFIGILGISKEELAFINKDRVSVEDLLIMIGILAAVVIGV